jgi:hypothetical protein
VRSQGAERRATESKQREHTVSCIRDSLIVEILSALAALLVAAPLSAQAPQTLKPGAPIRLEAFRSGDSLSVGAVVRLEVAEDQGLRPVYVQTIDGVVAALTSDTVRVHIPGRDAPVSFPLGAVRAKVPYSAQGRFAAVRSDTLFVTFDGDTAASSIPMALVARIERRSPGKRPFALAAFTGALIGASVGAIAAYRSYHPCQPPEPSLFGLSAAFSEMCSTFNLPSAVRALLGGMGGGLLGAGVGAVAVLVLVPREHWAEVPVDRLHPTVAPLSGGRLGLGASLAF